MCGIVGYSGTEEADASTIKTLLYLAQQRGRDSTGIATPTRTLKLAKDADEFIADEIIPTHKTVIGHTRRKTTGKISDENSHPFEFDDVIGVHNGYISNFYRLKREEGTTDMEVDSEIIFHLINKYGLEEAIPKMRGGFAIAWIDGDNNLNLYRHRNPIHIGFREEGMYFGSLSDYLEVIDCNDIQKIQEHYHYIINDGEILEERNLTDIKPKKYTRSTNHTRTQSHWNQHTQYNRRSGRENNTSFRDKHPPDSAPVDADHVLGNYDHALYYWFDDPTNTVLSVEAVYPGIKDQWVEKYELDNPKHLDSLEIQFPELIEQDKVKDVIHKINN